MVFSRKPAPLVRDLNPKTPKPHLVQPEPDQDPDGSKAIREALVGPAADVDVTAKPECWFITAAVLVSESGAGGQIASLIAAETEESARLTFIDGLLKEYGPQGLGVRSVVCSEVTGLAIVRIPDAA